VLGTTSYSLSLDLTDRETALAMQAARSKLDEVRSMDFDHVVASFDSIGSNDPDGADTAPGAEFVVEGLAMSDGSAVGTVTLPILSGGVVSEGMTVAALGMPRDLDGDGLTTNTSVDMATEALILPVVVTVRWDGVNGDREITYRAVVRR